MLYVTIHVHTFTCTFDTKYITRILIQVKTSTQLPRQSQTQIRVCVCVCVCVCVVGRGRVAGICISPRGIQLEMFNKLTVIIEYEFTSVQDTLWLTATAAK